MHWLSTHEGVLIFWGLDQQTFACQILPHWPASSFSSPWCFWDCLFSHQDSRETPHHSQKTLIIFMHTECYTLHFFESSLLFFLILVELNCEKHNNGGWDGPCLAKVKEHEAVKRKMLGRTQDGPASKQDESFSLHYFPPELWLLHFPLSQKELETRLGRWSSTYWPSISIKWIKKPSIPWRNA